MILNNFIEYLDGYHEAAKTSAARQVTKSNINKVHEASTKKKLKLKHLPKCCWKNGCPANNFQLKFSSKNIF